MCIPVSVWVLISVLPHVCVPCIYISVFVSSCVCHVPVFLYIVLDVSMSLCVHGSMCPPMSLCRYGCVFLSLFISESVSPHVQVFVYTMGWNSDGAGEGTPLGESPYHHIPGGEHLFRGDTICLPERVISSRCQGVRCPQPTLLSSLQ